MSIPNIPAMQLTPLQQPLNPARPAREAMAMHALYRSGHPEDYSNIQAAFSPPGDISTIAPHGCCKGKTVGIIGGGLAGMAAAFELRKAGFDITVFEASPERIGGRIYTYYFDNEKRLYGELGAMRIPISHETVWHYIDLFKLDTRPFIQSNPKAFIYLHGRRVLNDPYGYNVKRMIYPTYNLESWEYNYSWQQLGFYGLEKPVLEAPPQVRREILEVLPAYAPQTLYWDALNTRQSMERQKLSQGAINMLSSLFPIGGKFLYNNYIDFVQEYFPANFIYMYEISGGMVKLPDSFHKSFISPFPGKYYSSFSSELLGRVNWKNGCAVNGIYQSQYGGPVTLAYTINSMSKISHSQFDYVICAIPFSVLRVLDIHPLFTSQKMQAIKEVTYSPAQKTIFRCSRRFWEEQGIYGGGSYTDLPTTTIWYPSSSITGTSLAASTGIPDTSGMTAASENPGRNDTNMEYNKLDTTNEGVITASYSFNMDAVRLGNLPDKTIADKIMSDIEGVHGLPQEWLNSVITDSKTQLWDRDPLYRGTFCYFTPQQKKLFSWTMEQPEYGNRIFFAGEHVSAVHRWQQGALKSGMATANALAAAARQA